MKKRIGIHITGILTRMEKCCMQDDCYLELVRVRLERAEELIIEAEKLLSDDSYKSANNRAYYAMEKAINAVLIRSHIETKTHNGAQMMFNVNFSSLIE